VLHVAPGSLLNHDVAGQHNVFRLYWPGARADRFAMG
jgi:hypothetical protein